MITLPAQQYIQLFSGPQLQHGLTVRLLQLFELPFVLFFDF
jgi:hypothetical protein